MCVHRRQGKTKQVIDRFITTKFVWTWVQSEHSLSQSLSGLWRNKFPHLCGWNTSKPVGNDIFQEKIWNTRIEEIRNGGRRRPLRKNRIPLPITKPILRENQEAKIALAPFDSNWRVKYRYNARFTTLHESGVRKYGKQKQNVSAICLRTEIFTSLDDLSNCPFKNCAICSNTHWTSAGWIHQSVN